MTLLLTIIQILTAIIAPTATIVLAGLIIFHTTSNQDKSIPSEGICLRCGKSRKGAKGHFKYSANKDSSQKNQTSKNTEKEDNPILGTESHFVCNHCAHRYIRNEILQHILMVIAYPIYLYLFIPIFGRNGVFADFLIQTLLIVLSVAGTTSAVNQYFAVYKGEGPLSEARDHVAINERKDFLGKKFGYYSRMKKPN